MCCTAEITKERLQQIVFGSLQWADFGELLAMNALTFHQNRLAVMIEEDHKVSLDRSHTALVHLQFNRRMLIHVPQVEECAGHSEVA